MTAQEIQPQMSVWEQISRSVTEEIEEIERILEAKKKLNELRLKLAQDHLSSREMVILNAVAQTFRVTPEEIISRRRPDRIAFPRQVAMTLCYQDKQSALTLEAVANFFGKRDHGTVLYAIGAVQNRIEVNERERSKVEELRDLLKIPSPTEAA